MNSNLIITCGVFAGILAVALSFYIKHKDIFNPKIKILFIFLLSIDLIVFAYALVYSPESINLPPMVVSLMPDKTSPQEAGSIIEWTATALDPEKDRVQYKFLLDSQQRRDWSYNSTWRWMTSDADIGSHTIETKVKDGNHNADSDDSKAINLIISPHASLDQPPLINELVAAPDSPQIAGATITWTTDATDPEGDKKIYKYFLNGIPKTDWSKDNAWIWSTSEKDIRTNTIEVQIRDGKHAGPNGCDDHKLASFIIFSQTTNQDIAPGPVYSPEKELSQTASNGPVRLSNIKAYRSDFDTINYDSAGLMKIGKIPYEYGVQLSISSGLIYKQSNYDAYFNLNGEYSRLTGKIGLDDRTESNTKVIIAFGKDDDTLLTTFELISGKLPTPLDIDVSGADILIIEAPSNSPTAYIDLIDMELKKKPI